MRAAGSGTPVEDKSAIRVCHAQRAHAGGENIVANESSHKWKRELMTIQIGA